MRVLLDTNVYSQLVRGAPTLAQAVRGASELVFSVVVIGELLHGYRAGTRYEKNVSVLRRFVAQPFVELRDLTFETAEHFGRIQDGLRRKGSPIPANDVWIAAHAMEAGAELWTLDAHFRNVEGLNWRHLEA